MTSKDKQDVISICNILADKMSDSGKVAVQQIIGAVEDMVENEPCEDCISREEFEKRIKPYDTEDDMDKALYNFAHNILICCPSVTPKPKTGHWEWVQYDGNPEIGNFHCSECRYIPAIFNMSAQKLNYCPNCGAKMESGGIICR